MSLAEQEVQQPISGLAVASDEERLALDAALAQERAWYEDTPRFETEEDIAAAVTRGELRELHNSLALRRIARFDRGREGFAPFLTDRAWRAAHALADLWALTLYDDNPRLQDEDFRMAVTSMTRSQAYQDLLVADTTKLASPDSTHCTGNAFDIDVSAYYRMYGPNAMSISDGRRSAGSLAISAQLESEYGPLPNQISKHSSPYKAAITQTMIAAAQQMHKEGAINLIEEFKGTENACLHVAVNPDY